MLYMRLHLKSIQKLNLVQNSHSGAHVVTWYFLWGNTQTPLLLERHWQPIKYHVEYELRALPCIRPSVSGDHMNQRIPLTPCHAAAVGIETKAAGLEPQ